MDVDRGIVHSPATSDGARVVLVPPVVTVAPMTYTLVYVWPVTDPNLKLPGLILLAEEELADELDSRGVLLVDEPRWSLSGDRLVVTAPVRQRLPWDVHPDDAAKAYVLDMLPDAA